MYVKEIRLENVRGFHGARNVSLDLTRPDGSFAGWTVLAGRNGSGKTSLLRAVALAIGGPGVARNLVSDFASWVSVGKMGQSLRCSSATTRMSTASELADVHLTGLSGRA
ncbi:ATP-binding protein [Actinoplanes couchii]|uniref:Rad50/SbcC-type AAA domain-containing protein n=1 Tax=Actinoplanes couchii TaxID=403638 RepID=A0ABQ3XN30_9ACTN|nr:hypothetical protein Aco03nite_083260 [Actinoplanes couchii]